MLNLAPPTIIYLLKLYPAVLSTFEFQGLLQSFDNKIRSFVRELLDLPMDIPVSFYYNNIKDGGLSIPFLEKAIPKSIIKRVSKFRDSNDPAINDLTGTTSFQNLICRCCTILNVTSIEAGLSLDVHKQLRSDFYRTIDGSALSEFRTNSSGQSWLNGITNIVSGKNFRNLVKLRIGRLATLENCNRGREVNKKCRKCLRVNETMHHVIQGCHFTHFTRILRHNSIVDYLEKDCVDRGLAVTKEAKIDIGSEKLKPDLIIVNDDTIHVVDVTIVTANMRFPHLNGPTTLEGIWEHKVNLYNKPGLINRLKEVYSKDNIWFGAVVLSLRGMWCQKNDETLNKCGIPLSCRDILVIRSMERSLKIWSGFMKDTYISV